jgi:phosphoribosylamine---glycine ligase
MNVLIVGSGGREHAFAWRISQSPLVDKVFVAPGNGGTFFEDKTQNVDIAVTDIEALLQFSIQNNIDLTLVGPEAPLSLGIVDSFESHDLVCFGPNKAAAELESSKAYAKKFMQKYNIPTANYAEFSHIDSALTYLTNQNYPVVIKADGLAAGKGVIIATTYEQAEQAVSSMLSGASFGHAGRKIIIEEFIRGVEASFIIMTDGQTIHPLATSQDHKALYDNDIGPNTGGMGAYSPAPLLTPLLEEKIMTEVIKPTLQGMLQEQRPYVGFLYAGIMITPSGQFYVLEYNCRFGDPETQPILMRLKSDFAQLCIKATQQQLNEIVPEWDDNPALCVVMATKGYPNAYPKGDVINGIPESISKDCKIFHAGTCIKGNQLKTDGGRVLGVTAMGPDLTKAKHTAYEITKTINWTSGCYYRHDIGDKGLP